MLPNAVLIGAPKCGTSSVFYWLADHPDACGSQPKESFYLMDAEHPLLSSRANVHQDGLDGYHALFDHCAAGARVRLEATTHYLYQTTAREVLASLDPQPTIIALLRKPSERVYSSFRYSQSNLGRIRGSVDFAQFLEAVERGSLASIVLGDKSPRGTYVLERDVDYSRYARHLEPWLDAFGPEKLVVRLFEDMLRDPRAFTKDLAARLDLDPGFYDSYAFDASNPTYQVRAPTLQRWARNLAVRWPGAGRVRSLAKSAYLRFFTQAKAGRRSDADRSALARLEATYRDDNERLARKFRLDLSAWA